jgi:tetratricopeptide (TPR) repeat protein
MRPFSESNAAAYIKEVCMDAATAPRDAKVIAVTTIEEGEEESKGHEEVSMTPAIDKSVALVSKLAGADPLLVDLLSPMSTSALSELLAEKKGSVSVDDIFDHETMLASKDKALTQACLLVAGSLLPVVGFMGVYFDASLGKALAKKALPDETKFAKAWAHLEKCGWLTKHCELDGLWKLSTASFWAPMYMEKSEEALKKALKSSSIEQISADLWDVYYAYWSKEIASIGNELALRGVAINPVTLSTESPLDGLLSSKQEKHVAMKKEVLSSAGDVQLSLRQVIDKVDVNMVHISRLLTLFMDASEFDATTMASSTQNLFMVKATGPMFCTLPTSDMSHEQSLGSWTDMKTDESKGEKASESNAHDVPDLDEILDMPTAPSEQFQIKEKEKERRELMLEFLTTKKSMGLFPRIATSESTPMEESSNTNGTGIEELVRPSNKVFSKISSQVSDFVPTLLSLRMPSFRSVEIMKALTGNVEGRWSMLRARLATAEFLSTNYDSRGEAEQLLKDVLTEADKLCEGGENRPGDQMTIYFALARLLLGNSSPSQSDASTSKDSEGLQILEQLIYRLRLILSQPISGKPPLVESPAGVLVLTDESRLQMLYPHVLVSLGVAMAKQHVAAMPDSPANLSTVRSHYSGMQTPSAATSAFPTPNEETDTSPKKAAAPPSEQESKSSEIDEYGSVPAAAAGDEPRSIGGVSEPQGRTTSGQDSGATSTQSKSEQIKEAFQEASQVYRTLYGELSSTAAETNVSLANFLRSTCKYDEAQKLYETALPVFKESFEGPNARTGYAMSGLGAVVRRDSNRQPYARRLLEEALKVFHSVYDDDHPAVSSCANALATLLTMHMRYDRAIALYERSLYVARRAVNNAKGIEAKERETAAVPPILVTIASLHDKVGRHIIAAPLYQEAITTYRDLYGNKHVSVADTLCLLADSTFLRHRRKRATKSPEGAILHDGYDEAKHLIRDALEIYAQVGMRDRPPSVKAWKQLAALHEFYQAWEDGKNAFEKVLSIYVRVHIGVCEELVDTYIAFGKLLCLAEEYGEAMTLFKQAQSLLYQLFGDVHVKLAEVSALLGGAYIGVKEFEDAQPFYEKAIVLYSETVGPECTEVAECYNNIGFIMQELDEYEEAKVEYQKALGIFGKRHGRFHPGVANVLNSLATLYDDLDEHENAIKHYDQTIYVLRKLYGDMHPKVALTLENLATLLDDIGLNEKAEDARAEAAAIQEKLDVEANGEVDVGAPTGERTSDASSGERAGTCAIM